MGDKYRLKFEGEEDFWPRGANGWDEATRKAAATSAATGLTVHIHCKGAVWEFKALTGEGAPVEQEVTA